MSSVNKQILIGNLGKDPELRYMANGDPVVNFSVATSQKWKDGEGNPQEETQWHRCVAFRRLAEICNEYLRSGYKVYVEGITKHRKYEKDGVERWVTEVIIDEMKMLGAPREQGDGGNAQRQPAAARQPAGRTAPAPRSAPPAARSAPAPRQAAPRPASGFDDMDSDIPF